jgi:hypothetical protein
LGLHRDNPPQKLKPIQRRLSLSYRQKEDKMLNPNQIFVDTEGQEYTVEEMQNSYPEILKEYEETNTMLSFYTLEEFRTL